MSTVRRPRSAARPSEPAGSTPILPRLGVVRSTDAGSPTHGVGDTRAVREQWFARATELDPMGPTIRAVDWASTSWGPPEDWAPGLRSAVEICMSTRFPVLVTWGPDLLMLYNDGYRAMLGSDKQVGATGKPVSQVWSEIWTDISPLFDTVLSTGTPVYQEDIALRINRSGYDEDAWFTFCYSALRDPDGQVQGVLDISSETTDQVVARRRLSLVSTLSTRLHATTGDVDALGRVVADVLGRAEDLQAVELSLFVDEQLIPLARANARDVPLLDPSSVPEMVRSHRPQVVGDTFVMPLTGSAADPVVGVLALRASSGRAPDARQIDFMELIGVTVASALSTSVKHMTEVGELRHVSRTLQESMLPTLTASSDAVARYLPATGSLAVGGDWYDSVDQDTKRVALVVGDCVGHGLAAAAVMAQLRTASRTLLIEGHGPAQMLTALDRFAGEVPGAECATVVCSTLDVVTGELVYASAGHLPALVVGPRGHRWLDGGRGIPLAVLRTSARDDATDVLGADEVLLVFTDGLVERRGESLDVGLDRLARAVTAVLDDQDLHALDLEDLVDGILRLLVPQGSSDDIALIAQRRPQ